MKLIYLTVVSLLFAGCNTPSVQPENALPIQNQRPETKTAENIEVWLASRRPIYESEMLKNISPNLSGYKKGFVTAAPWAVPGVQDYRFHWVRDGAIVMNTIVTRWLEEKNEQTKLVYKNKLNEYLNFSRENQKAPEPSGAEKVGLGEVKFNPDGSRFTNWMRPQNDGPALRAITVIRYANQLLQQNKIDLAKHLYDGKTQGSDGINAPGLIKSDLDYILNHWRDLSYDPWEEVKGHHFYTRLVQRKALLDGAKFALALKDTANARLYKEAVFPLETAITSHFIPEGRKLPNGENSQGQVWDTFDRAKGIEYKSTGLDVAVVLGALHAHNENDPEGDRFFSASDDRILKTASLLIKSFEQEYPLAKSIASSSDVGVPIGRYPKDKYNGYDGKTFGNPWYLATAGVAELYYACSIEWKEAGLVSVTPLNIEFLSSLTSTPLKVGQLIEQKQDAELFEQMILALRNRADMYLRRVQTHEGPGGHLTEEYKRDSGAPTGAEDLSWSYASLLSAAHRRAEDISIKTAR